MNASRKGKWALIQKVGTGLSESISYREMANDALLPWESVILASKPERKEILVYQTNGVWYWVHGVVSDKSAFIDLILISCPWCGKKLKKFLFGEVMGDCVCPETINVRVDGVSGSARRSNGGWITSTADGTLMWGIAPVDLQNSRNGWSVPQQIYRAKTLGEGYTHDYVNWLEWSGDIIPV